MNDTKSVRKSSFAIVSWLRPAIAVLVAALMVYTEAHRHQRHRKGCARASKGIAGLHDHIHDLGQFT